VIEVFVDVVILLVDEVPLQEQLAGEVVVALKRPELTRFAVFRLVLMGGFGHIDVSSP
jgi:hypothetical protein